MTNGEPVTRDTIIWAARQIVRQHNEPPNPDRATGRCAQCGPEHCPLPTWATAVLAHSEGDTDPTTTQQ